MLVAKSCVASGKPMSRIGTKSIALPAGVTLTVADHRVAVKGPKGELSEVLPPKITVEVEDGKVIVKRASDERQVKAWHGLMRSLTLNMIMGVTEGYKKTLELVGTGYRVTKKGQGITLAVGYSHTVDFSPLPGVTIEVEGNNMIHVSGMSKHDVGQVAANIREVRPPEPYQGKGIRYQNEQVRRKAGKTAAK